MPRLEKGEPRIKTVRSDILRGNEIEAMINQAGLTYDLSIQCLIALLWLFGKRISEVIALKRKDIYVKNDMLYVRFTVLKKKKIGLRRDREVKPWLETIKKQYLKNITLEHSFTKYVLQYIEEPRFYKEEGYKKTLNEEALLFPGMYRTKAWRYIKHLDPKAWLHLFRESLATTWAEEGSTEEDLMHWFDWDRISTAHEYVKRGTKLIEHMAKRTW
jgi:integrase